MTKHEARENLLATAEKILEERGIVEKIYEKNKEMNPVYIHEVESKEEMMLIFRAGYLLGYSMKPIDDNGKYSVKFDWSMV
jgi:hypothetical protein